MLRGAGAGGGNNVRRIGRDGRFNVLQPLQAKGAEANIDLAQNVPEYLIRNDKVSGAAYLLQPGCDVHFIAEKIAVVGDDVAHMDADAKANALFSGNSLFRASMERWHSMALRVASTGLANSAIQEFPATPNMRPPPDATLSSISWR